MNWPAPADNRPVDGPRIGFAVPLAVRQADQLWKWVPATTCVWVAARAPYILPTPPQPIRPRRAL